MKYKHDLTGKKFNEITVLGFDKILSEQKKRAYWKCRCSCGREKSIRADGLKKIITCGECQKDLTGKIFDRLTVLKKGKKDRNGHQYYICKCNCGNIVEVNSDNLRRGLTKSCGCFHSEIMHQKLFQDLTGQRFGKLLVISPVENDFSKRIKWHCLCDCGTFVDVASNNLKNGHTISCGCIHSKGEFQIRNILNSLQINFKTEYIFKDLPNRRFDFAIFNNDKLILLIEFHGKQHYSFIQTQHKTQEEFIKAKNRDKEKEKFCQNHNIPLLIIPYWELEKINEEYILNKIQEVAAPDMEEVQEIIEEE